MWVYDRIHNTTGPVNNLPDSHQPLDRLDQFL